LRRFITPSCRFLIKLFSKKFAVKPFRKRVAVQRFWSSDATLAVQRFNYNF